MPLVLLSEGLISKLLINPYLPPFRPPGQSHQTLSGGQSLGGDWVALPEGGERFGHATRVLHLQEVRGAWDNDPLGMRQPADGAFPRNGARGHRSRC